MSTFPQPISCAFGTAYANLTSAIRYQVLDSGGTEKIAATNSGVTEIADGNGGAHTTGLYRASFTADNTWSFPLQVVWTINSVAAVAAVTTIYNDRAALNADGYTPTRAGYLDTLQNLVNNIWTSGTRTLTGFGTLATDTATAVWAAGTRSLTTFGTLASDAASAVWGSVSRTLTAFGFSVAPTAAQNRAEIDANSSRLNAIQTKTDFLPSAAAGTNSGLALKSDVASGGGGPSADTIAAAVVAKDEIQNMAAAVGSVTGGTRSGVTGQPTITETLVRPDGGTVTRVATDTTLTVTVEP